MNTFDAIIIGFGKGGKTLAADLADRNWKVAVIERDRGMYGGTCINIGCIPTKYLIQQAKITEFRELQNVEELRENYKQAIENKNQLIASLRQKNFDNLNKRENITIYNGEASFVSDHEVKVDMGNEAIVLSSDKILINTGAEPVIPKIEGISDSPFVHTSTSIMNLEEFPKRLAIIGGGYIGLEFAFMYSEFGCQVSVLEGSTQFIAREDRDVAEAVKESLEEKRVAIELQAEVKFIENGEHEAIITYDVDGEIRKLPVDAILLATGRKPNIEGLNLEAAGVEVTDRGAIQVDESLRTTVPHIWALGDVKGGLQFTYISLDDYRIVKDEWFGDQKRKVNDRMYVPYSVFVDPPLSRVGLSEEEARQEGYSIKVAKLPMTASPLSRLMNKTEGFMKAIVDAKTNKILGAVFFCDQSYELINMVSMAMKLDQDYTFLRDHIFTHPTMSEALNDLFTQIQ